jgi:hypothetical protein
MSKNLASSTSSISSSPACFVGSVGDGYRRPEWSADSCCLQLTQYCTFLMSNMSTGRTRQCNLYTQRRATHVDTVELNFGLAQPDPRLLQERFSVVTDFLFCSVQVSETAEPRNEADLNIPTPNKQWLPTTRRTPLLLHTMVRTQDRACCVVVSSMGSLLQSSEEQPAHLRI